MQALAAGNSMKRELEQDLEMISLNISALAALTVTSLQDL
jgi:hypothetical protein